MQAFSKSVAISRPRSIAAKASANTLPFLGSDAGSSAPGIAGVGELRLRVSALLGVSASNISSNRVKISGNGAAISNSFVSSQTSTVGNAWATFKKRSPMGQEIASTILTAPILLPLSCVCSKARLKIEAGGGELRR
ncbi:hypothetical protein D9M70_483160 [compost metagenome]